MKEITIQLSDEQVNELSALTPEQISGGSWRAVVLGAVGNGLYDTVKWVVSNAGSSGIDNSDQFPQYDPSGAPIVYGA